MRFKSVALLLAAAAAGAYVLLVILGAQPVPRNGRGIGEAIGSCGFLFVMALAAAAIAHRLTRNSPTTDASLMWGLLGVAAVTFTIYMAPH